MPTFDQIYTPENRRNVMNICFRILRNHADAEDAAQTAFLNAAVKLDSYEGRNGASVTTWLMTIARNSAHNQLRTRYPVEMLSLDSVVSSINNRRNRSETLGATIPDPRLSPETKLFFREVQEMMMQLPVRGRRQLQMFTEGFSLAEIGTMLGIVSAASVKVTICRTRQRLKEQLGV